MNLIPRPLRGSATTRYLLAALLALSVALHIGIAAERGPAGPRYGTVINGKTTDAMPESIRIAAWNIRRGKGLDGRRDLTRIAAGLTGFDVVGLNEVGGAIAGDDQAARLGQMLDLGWQFTPSQRRWYSDYFGNALLSRFAPEGWESVPIIHDLDRGVGHRHLQTIHYRWQGRDLAILLFHAERGPIRDRQIERAVREFKRHQTAVLLGDFNADQGAPVIRRLLDDPDVTAALTEPGIVDWIFTRGIRIEDAGLVPPGASDHPLVWAEIKPANDS